MIALNILFITVLIIIVYTYLGYPVLLLVVAKFRSYEVKKSDILPKVSLIIAAFNEEKAIEKKIMNSLALDYPKDKLEIIVASDGSIDNTNNKVLEFKNEQVKLLKFEKRKGKTHVQNESVKLASGEIVFFSDATTLYDPSIIKEMVSNFYDDNVGLVGGELVYVNKYNMSMGEGNGMYWKYERFIKIMESRITSLIGVSGCCYAVRKESYEPIDDDLISDFVIAQLIYKKGKRAVYEQKAFSYEETNETMKDEFMMRERVSVRSLYGLFRMRELLNIKKYGFFALQLLSHKVLRYIIPVFIILLFIVSLLLAYLSESNFYKLFFLLQVTFFISAIMGFLLNKSKTIFNLPFYFCLTNFALLMGLFKFINGERMKLWKPIR